MSTFYFQNPQTHHYFSWLLNHPQIKTENLVAEALRRAEGDSRFKMGECTSRVARDQLAEILGDILDKG